MYFERERIKLPDGIVQGNNIDIGWLKQASREEQYEALFIWFTNQYEDPAHSLPYETAEGGYIAIYGELVSPFEKLNEFDDIVPRDIIESVSKELFDIAGDEWSPIPSLDNFYEIKETSLDKFEIRVARVLELLSIKDDFLVKASVFSLLFTAFETYLWEKTKESLCIEGLNLEKNLIQNMKEFKEKFSLSDIYTNGVDINERLHQVLDSEIVWHNIKNLTLIFKSGFMLDSLPYFENIQKSLDKRHNIVHRFGMNTEGYEMPLTNEDILELKTDLILFAQELERKISNKLSTLSRV